jgi:hypothetical protein
VLLRQVEEDKSQPKTKASKTQGWVNPFPPPNNKHISLFKVKNESAFFMYLIKNEGKCPHFWKF